MSSSDAKSRTLLGCIATGNPFYVISAGLFLVGLRVSFGDPDNDVNIGALAIGLAGYTVLLALAAVVLVRFARIWNDVRTVLLLVVLLFLATSVTFDELLVMNSERGTLLNLGGLAFSIVVSEAILRAIRLRLPLGFKLPYYLMLGLFFLYPLALLPVMKDPHGEAVQWRLFAFSSVAGLAFLTLLPTIRRGPEYLEGNGSPWPWPFYPWSLFAFLAVAVVGRAYLLCKSFHLLDDESTTDTIFAPYFLVPFGFVLAILLLELGLVARSRTAMLVGLVMPALLAILAGIGHREELASTAFLELFRSRVLATPLFLTVLLAIGLNLYAWVRGVPLAAEGLTAALAALAFVEPETLALGDIALVRPDQLIFPVLLQAFLGVVKRDVWRVIAVGSVAAAWLTGAAWRLYIALRSEVAGLDYLLVSLVLLPIAVFVSLAKSGWKERTR